MSAEASYLAVRIVDLSGISTVCREFHGPYGQSPEYVAQVKEYLQEQNLSERAGHEIGIYFDLPGELPSEELRSYQGILIDGDSEVEEPYFIHRLRGKHLCVTVRADQPDQLSAAYGALYGYASANHIDIASAEGIQITRLAGELVLMDIYLEIGSGSGVSQSAD